MKVSKLAVKVTSIHTETVKSLYMDYSTSITTEMIKVAVVTETSCLLCTALVRHFKHAVKADERFM